MTTDDPVANWRPIRDGEDIREWTRTIDAPMRRENIVRSLLEMSTNAERGAFLQRIRKRYGEDFYNSLRQEVWRRLT